MPRSVSSIRVDRADEGVAQVVDFGRRAKLLVGEQRRIVAGLVGADAALQPAQRADQQAVDQPPADQRGDRPHQHRQQDQQQALDAW